MTVLPHLHCYFFRDEVVLCCFSLSFQEHQEITDAIESMYRLSVYSISNKLLCVSQSRQQRPVTNNKSSRRDVEDRHIAQNFCRVFVERCVLYARSAGHKRNEREMQSTERTCEEKLQTIRSFVFSMIVYVFA